MAAAFLENPDFLRKKNLDFSTKPRFSQIIKDFRKPGVAVKNDSPEKMTPGHFLLVNNDSPGHYLPVNNDYPDMFLPFTRES